MGTHVYLWVKYFKNVLKYKYQYLSIITYIYLSTSTQVHGQYLSTYLSTNVLKYSSSLLTTLRLIGGSKTDECISTAVLSRSS